MSHSKSEGNFSPSNPTTLTECPTPEATSAMLAKEMNQLSVEDREKVLEDIHGIARAVDEPLDYVRNSLLLLEEELSKPTPNKAAYDLAKSQSKEYVSSEKLRMMFLRAESFDACKAAARMIRFFDEKYNLFGVEKLTKDIVLADLDPDDIAALDTGFYQVLPEKDCAGRNVVCFFPKLRAVRTMQNQLRAVYYIFMRVVEDDEEAQQRGVVGFGYCVDGDFRFQGLPRFLPKTAKLRNALPARFVSFHICYNDPRLFPVISFVMFIVATHTRLRFRAHYGSHEECLCKLSCFGFPTSALPMSPRGEFNLEHHRTFMARDQSIAARKSGWKEPLGVEQEAKKKPIEKAASRHPITEDDVFVAAPPHGTLTGFSNAGFLSRPMFAKPWWSVIGAPNSPSVLPTQSQRPVASHQSHISGPPTSASRPPATLRESPTIPHVIYNPGPNDILLGRGKPIQERPGNVRFRDMLDKHLDKYEHGGKGAKVKVGAYIVHIVKEEGGRFLKELKDGGWVEIDEAAARKKVSHAFRARRGVFQEATLKNEKSNV